MKLRESIESVFAAAAFAEADQRDEALAIMNKKVPSPRRATGPSFLDIVGLSGVRVAYITATV
jgi:hypothetical protein